MTGSWRSLHNLYYQTFDPGGEPAWMAGFVAICAWAVMAGSLGCAPSAPPREAAPAPSGPSSPTGPAAAAANTGAATEVAGPASAIGPAGSTGTNGPVANAATQPTSTSGSSAAPSGPAASPVPPVAPAATPPAAPLPVAAAEAHVPGAVVALSPGAPTSIEPASTFEVRVGVPVRGARLVLLDAQDVMVPSASQVEVGQASKLTLVPEETLRPGSTYTLRLEGLAGRLVASDGGAAYEPAVFALQTTGTPPPKPAPKKARKRRGP